MKYTLSYLIDIQFLGFRFSGWQKQTNAKTLHDMVDKSLSFVFEHVNFKTIGIGRTDAKVSANSFYIQLFTDDILEETSFLESLNTNFSPDFKAISIQEVAIKFVYLYLIVRSMKCLLLQIKYLVAEELEQYVKMVIVDLPEFLGKCVDVNGLEKEI